LGIARWEGQATIGLFSNSVRTVFMRNGRIWQGLAATPLQRGGCSQFLSNTHFSHENHLYAFLF
jgi:hypothetical protein